MREIRPFFFDITEQDIARFRRESASILRSGVLVLGEQTERFEKEFAHYIGTKHAVAVNSGSSALEFLLRTKGVEGKTVLVPTNTNFATAAAVIRAGGRVRYLDMSEHTFAPTLSMVRHAVEQARSELAGVLWVHIGGVVSTEFPDVVAFCRGEKLFVLEDCAHAHGSAFGGIKAGKLADGAAFSFFATRVMSTCEGGIVTTHDTEEDYLLRSLRNQGKRDMDYGGLHHDFGNSSRLPEITALLGRLQLRRLPHILQKRQTAYETITARLADAGVGYVSTDHMDSASHYKLIVRIPAGLRVEDVKRALLDDGVVPGGAVYETPCHRQPVFSGLGNGGSWPVAEHWCPRHICPPLTSGMSEQDTQRVGASLARNLAERRTVRRARA